MSEPLWISLLSDEYVFQWGGGRRPLAPFFIQTLCAPYTQIISFDSIDTHSLNFTKIFLYLRLLSHAKKCVSENKEVNTSRAFHLKLFHLGRSWKNIIKLYVHVVESVSGLL